MLLLLSPAWAGSDLCQTCCRAGGLPGCGTELRVLTEGSRVARTPSGWSVVGVWVLSCESGARYEADLAIPLDHEPAFGEIVSQNLNPLALHCFDQACVLPRGVCLSRANEQGQVLLVGCDDDLPVDSRSLQAATRRAPSADARVVVVDGKPLVARELRPAEPAAAGAPASSAYAPAAAPAPAPAPTATYAPAAAAAPVSTTAPVAFDVTLPPEPANPCPPAMDALKSEARKHVDLGDEHRMRHDAAAAGKEYRAALSMDPCSAYAWIGVGQAATDAARVDIAVKALQVGVRLAPSHYTAWTLLGRNYELMGQRALAAEAYGRALAQRPTLQEAQEGLARTR